MIPQTAKRIGHRNLSKKEVFRYTQLTYLNIKSVTLENFGNLLKQKNKNTKHKKQEYLHYLMKKLQNTLVTILSPESLCTDTTVSF